MNGVQKRYTAEDIYLAVLHGALSPSNMYYTHLALSAMGESREPTAAEAMMRYLEHDGYRMTLRSLGVEEYPLTSNTPPQERAHPIRSD